MVIITVFYVDQTGTFGLFKVCTKENKVFIRLV